jgi:hypothetical protein
MGEKYKRPSVYSIARRDQIKKCLDNMHADPDNHSEEQFQIVQASFDKWDRAAKGKEEEEK